MSMDQDFYVTGGAMGAEAPSYVKRRADTELHDALTRGEFCYVLTPSQMGKSSLMAHAAASSPTGRRGRPDRPDGRRRESRRRAVVLHPPRSRSAGPGAGGRVAGSTGRATCVARTDAAMDGGDPGGRAAACVGRVVVFVDEIGVVAKLPVRDRRVLRRDPRVLPPPRRGPHVGSADVLSAWAWPLRRTCSATRTRRRSTSAGGSTCTTSLRG